MDRTIYEETGIGISANDLSNYMKDDNIACENLSSKFMLKNRKLSRAASDAGFSKFKQILGYEAFKHQTKVIFVNPKYTTQDCSVCRNRIKKDLSARVHECHYWQRCQCCDKYSFEGCSWIFVWYCLPRNRQTTLELSESHAFGECEYWTARFCGSFRSLRRWRKKPFSLGDGRSQLHVLVEEHIMG